MGLLNWMFGKRGNDEKTAASATAGGEKRHVPGIRTIMDGPTATRSTGIYRRTVGSVSPTATGTRASQSDSGSDLATNYLLYTAMTSGNGTSAASVTPATAVDCPTPSFGGGSGDFTASVCDAGSSISGTEITSIMVPVFTGRHGRHMSLHL